MALIDSFYVMVSNKCPRCHQGKIFENNNPYNLKNGLKMVPICSHCGLKYEREVGYFYGAMYVSYGLQVGIFASLFALNTLWWNFANPVIITMVIAPIILLFPVTFRWSRSLWIAFFTPFDRSLHS